MKAQTTRENLKKYKRLYYKKRQRRPDPVKSLFAAILIWQLIVWQVIVPLNLPRAVAADTEASEQAALSETTKDTDSSEEKDVSEDESQSESADSESEANDSAEPDSDDSSSLSDDGAKDEASDRETSDRTRQDETDSADTPEDGSTLTEKSDPANSAAESTTPAAAGGESQEDPISAASASTETAPEELWQTCGLSELLASFENTSESDECKTKTSCDEIKICLTGKIEMENDARVDNDIETSADTGENTIDPSLAPRMEAESRLEGRDERSSVEENDEYQNEEEDAAEITSGDAVAVADVANEANTNVIGGNGIALVENIYGDFEEDINLLDSFNSLIENSINAVGEGLSAFDALEISVENEADVSNDIETSADTGENEIDNETENGGSLITTGEAVAAANVANVVNTTIVGYNFLFAVINVFGNWIGDLIVPGEDLLSVPESGQPENLIVEVKNESEVANDVQTLADTGSNTIESGGENALIETGQAYSESVIVDQIGSTKIANNWFFLAINNMGNWVGNVLNWNAEKDAYENVFSFDFDENDESIGPLSSWLAKIFIQNEATIENDVLTTANTGANEIEAEGGNAAIMTGNAYAFSKVFNMVNNTFVGNNWLFAVVNIFGSWQGNVEFAYPDLSVSLSNSAGTVRKGDSYAYDIQVKNHGKADCSNVEVALAVPDEVQLQDGKTALSLAQLKAGEEKTFRVSVRVSENLSEGTDFLESKAAVAAETKEVEMGNNIATDKVAVDRSASEATIKQISPMLTLSRSASKKKIKVGEIADHTIEVKNAGNSIISDILISDGITNKKGAAGDYSWRVSKLDPGQKAVVKYKLLIKPDAPTGNYRNTALASGYDENQNEVRSNEAGVRIAVGNLDQQLIGNEEYLSYLTYYTYYTVYSEGPMTKVDDGSSIIPTAEAAANGTGTVLGDWTRNVCTRQPWWNWFLVGFFYFTAVHWALLRQSGKRPI